jgi:two-component system response regulator VanR
MFDGCRILIVDDNKDSCEIMNLILKHSNDSYDVTMAYTAREALDLIERSDFDLFILDSRLPDSSGVELCRRIRENDQKTPIIFYSGLSGEVFRETAKQVGADEYLVKPDDLDIFAETVQRNMKQCLADHSIV